MTVARHMRQGQCTSPRHDTEAAYSAGCSCPEAREKWRLYRKRLREGRQPSALIDATGTARRLQALVAFGYTFVDLSREVGISRRQVKEVADGVHLTTYRATAAAVRAAYDRLSTAPGGKSYAHTVARRRGWVPPLAWDDDQIDRPDGRPWTDDGVDRCVDEVAIQRAVSGLREKLTRTERHHAVYAARARGMSFQATADALRMSAARARELYNKPLPEAVAA